MRSITIIFTCYNRKEKTLKCLETIEDESLKLSYIAVDDKSTDGTAEAIKTFLEEKNREYELLDGTGSLYWAGGMRRGMGHYLEQEKHTDYVALINDDVEFEKGVLQYMIEKSEQKNGAVIAGSTKDRNGRLSYGGVIYRKGTVKYETIPTEKADEQPCDTFNCNCVLIPDVIFRKAGNFDEHYTHSLADFDYGFRLKKLGISVWATDKAIGICDDNPSNGTWRDSSLTRRERLKKKESPKGLPFKEWFYYLKNNFGLSKAIWHSLTPYIRIITGK